MPDDFSESEKLTRHFPTFERELNRWRRIARWRGEEGTIEFLRRIDAERESLVPISNFDLGSRAWLFQYRAGFRQVIAHGHPAAIKVYLAECPPEMVPVVVWLWGRCADRFRLYGLAEFCHDPSPQVRKHVAKALRRLEAWSLLRDMAEAYQDDAKICWFATAPTTHRPFDERLRSFTSHIDDSHADEVATPSQMPFWSLERMWERTPPKSLLAIRRMLRRIQHWVRWGAS